MKHFYLFIIIGFIQVSSFSQKPNILLVIADDLGVDYSNGYHSSELLPTTPTLDSLRASGITFMNVFSTPKCTPSRATIMSGKHGIKTGVLNTPSNLNTTDLSIFRAIEQETNNEYSDAVIGKWHISHPTNANHPQEHGADYYTGVLKSGVTDYNAWEHTDNNGVTTIDTNYATTAFTDASINWINSQTKPWFLWLAHVAPHGPYHTPPAYLHTISNTENTRRKYVAMIESLDYELGRLIDNITPSELENTIIIFVGDNGTPTTVLQNYPSGHGKGSIYQGGIHVPMIVSGKGVTRKGEKENAMVHITDLYATILELTGTSIEGGIYNSLSFKHLLDNSAGSKRNYNYTENVQGSINEFAIRNERYKLIESISADSQEFYDLLDDPLETKDLIPLGLTTLQTNLKIDFETEATQRRDTWSCNDQIQNGDEQGIDCGGSNCSPCSSLSLESLLDENSLISTFPNPFENELTIVSTLDNYRIVFFDILGQKIFSYTGDKKQTTIDLSSMSNGIYMIKFFNKSNQLVNIQKIIKK